MSTFSPGYDISKDMLACSGETLFVVVSLVSGVMDGVQFVQYFEVRSFLGEHEYLDNCHPQLKPTHDNLSRPKNDVRRALSDVFGGLVDIHGFFVDASGTLVCALLKGGLGGY